MPLALIRIGILRRRLLLATAGRRLIAIECVMFLVILTRIRQEQFVDHVDVAVGALLLGQRCISLNREGASRHERQTHTQDYYGYCILSIHKR